MIELVARKLPLVADLCGRYGVDVLELFGSAARGEFDPDRSDLDFFVIYAPGEHPIGPADRFFGLQAELEETLGHKVDLTEILVAQNPYFVASALKHRDRVYESERAKAAVRHGSRGHDDKARDGRQDA